jgi:hypothetical protein
MFWLLYILLEHRRRLLIRAERRVYFFPIVSISLPWIANILEKIEKVYIT